MLSSFPELLFLSPFAPLLIRVALGLLLTHDAWHTVSHSDLLVRIRSLTGIILAAALFAGAWTQLAALATVFILTLSLVLPRLRTLPLSSTLLALTMALSLVVTGAGALAFDLPL